MHFRFSFLLGCLLAATLGVSKATVIPSSHHPGIQINLSCKLPAPTDFHVVEQGATWVTFEFTPYNDAVQNRIKTYRASDDFLLDNRVVQAGIAKVTVDQLPENTDYYTTINTICEDGSDSPQFLRLDNIALITDIIVAGFTSGENRVCTISSINQACSFPGGGIITPFRIYKDADFRDFGVFDNGPNKFQVNIMSNGGGPANDRFVFTCDYNAAPNCYYSAKVHVYHQASGSVVLAAQFELIKVASSLSYLKCSMLLPGYKIDQFASGQARPLDKDSGSIQGRAAFRAQGLQAVRVSPNPFADILNVYPEAAYAENIQLQLYNLAGQKVLDQPFIGGQEQYALATADLSPGFYLLRIEADGEVQTLKVIKSE